MKRWRRATLHGGKFSELERRRMASLDRRKVFRFSPCSTESRVVTRMIDSGFFLTNPKEAGTSPPASMYFDPTEAAAYEKEHPDARFWTVVDADSENGQFLEQGVRFVNRVAYLIEDADWKPSEGQDHQ